MTELSQPLTASAADSAVVESAQAVATRAPTFSELVYAHFDWWGELQRNAVQVSTKRAYAAAVTQFERRHGEIVHAYWCSHVESAVALTEKKRRLPWATPICTFHRESDWATQNSPDIASQLHRCDELAVRARTVLTGVRQRICLQLVVASAAHLLSLVDGRASHADEEKTASALRHESESLTRAEEYYCEAANGQAQIVYFVGMAAVAAAIAGAVGAVVSVIQRINNGKFELDYDVGRPYALFLGGLRPLIGGAFAMAISFAFGSGLLHLPLAVGEPDDHRRLALLVLGFLAGFSERWAQDTLTSVLPASRGKSAGTSPASPGGDASGRA